MSNSSNIALAAEPKIVAQDDLWVVRLLRAMSLEWADLSGKIAELGASLSGSAFTGADTPLVRDMQAFDALSQRAFAQFRALEGICQELTSASESGPSFESFIDALPFADLRQRFTAALTGEEPPPPDTSADDEIWFE